MLWGTDARIPGTGSQDAERRAPGSQDAGDIAGDAPDPYLARIERERKAAVLQLSPGGNRIWRVPARAVSAFVAGVIAAICCLAYIESQHQKAINALIDGAAASVETDETITLRLDVMEQVMNAMYDALNERLSFVEKQQDVYAAAQRAGKSGHKIIREWERAKSNGK
jgi:hypothetical protein